MVAVDANALRQSGRPLLAKSAVPMLPNAAAPEDTRSTRTASADRPIAGAACPIAEEWLSEPPEPRRYLLEQDDPDTECRTSRGWLPLGKVGILAAGGGVGKTMALVQLAVSVATGRDWYGLHVANPGQVLLALAEEDAEEIRRRIYNAARLANLTPSERQLVVERIVAVPLAGTPVALLKLDDCGNAVETPTLVDLRETLATRSDWKLVVLDPLVRWAGVDAETDNAEATRFVEAVETLVRASGSPTVVLSHHTSKAARRDGDREATAARGASALVDGVRWCATMVPGQVGDLRTVSISVAKTNYSHPGEPITLVRDADGALRLLDRAEATAHEAAAENRAIEVVAKRVLDLIPTGHFTSVEELRIAAKCGKSPLRRALAQLTRDGKITKEGNRLPWKLVS